MPSQASEIMQAAKQICEEKNISLESVVETIEAALAVAYRKDFGEKNQNIKVDFELETANARVFDVKTVVSDEKFEQTEKLRLEAEAREQEEAARAEAAGGEPLPPAAPARGEARKREEQPTETDAEDEFERFNPKTEITLTEAQKAKPDAKEGDVIKTELVPPAAYGRMAAQTAKQVIIQRLREAERIKIFEEFKDKEGEVINGTVQRIEGRMVLVDLGHTTALMPPSEQVRRERYTPGQRLKFYLVAVNETPKGPEIILSRAHAEMVKKLFFLEVPEIGNGSVEIRSIAREAGSRTKLAVTSNQKNIDPVGSCVGQRGSRVQTVISEIGGEKIDIIEWDADPVKFISNALSPAKVLSVRTHEAEKVAVAEVKEDQLSLAIGKTGQNVRLSAKLTGWKIDIVSEAGEKVVPAAAAEDGTVAAPAEAAEGETAVTDEAAPADAAAADATEKGDQVEAASAADPEAAAAEKPEETPAAAENEGQSAAEGKKIKEAKPSA